MVIAGSGEADFAAARAGILRLREDAGLPGRCRREAEARFDAASGARRFSDLCRRMIAR